VITYRPVILSLHQDAGIRFWSEKGNLLLETVAMTKRTGVAVTAYATDGHYDTLITGEYTGPLSATSFWSL